MLVGEAPGRLGAQRSGVPFDGDVAGQRLARLITAAGWSREELFITNAVLCNPLDERGRNRPPKAAEVTRCTVWLTRQLELVNPTLVVALGRVAMDALRRIDAHELTLRDAGLRPSSWSQRWLAAAYHPSARAAIHRPLERQIADFEVLGDWWRVQQSNTAPPPRGSAPPESRPVVGSRVIA